MVFSCFVSVIISVRYLYPDYAVNPDYDVNRKVS